MSGGMELHAVQGMVWRLGWIKSGTVRGTTPRATMMAVRLVEAQYENGVLRPVERLGLRPGECVKLIVMRRPDPSRWDLARLARTGNGDDLPLAEQGLAEWTSSLEATERS
jgi:predicted DNA-binding antitoxin AbrB/MazE fold protein